MAAILAGPKRMVNADRANLRATPPRHAARGWPPNSLLLGPGTKRPGEGNRPLGQPSQRSQWFSISRVEPLFILLFFHSKLMSFLKSSIRVHTRVDMCARA